MLCHQPRSEFLCIGFHIDNYVLSLMFRGVTQLIDRHVIAEKISILFLRKICSPNDIVSGGGFCLAIEIDELMSL
jgi:hypothetical protein